MSATQKTILLTGFGPFPGVAENISASFASSLANQARTHFANINVHAETLPTVWGTAQNLLNTLLLRYQPDISLHFGVSERAQNFVIETLAHNACEATQDANGNLPSLKKLEINGPDTCAVTLPAQAIVDNLKRHGLAATKSTNPGRYLCNAVFYQVLREPTQTPSTRLSGFIHMPVHFVDDATPGSFTRDKALEGGLVILKTCLEAKMAVEQG